MASAPSVASRPTQNAKETLIGMMLSLEQRFGCEPRHDHATTLNTKFQVLQNRLPANPRLVRWFCWGVAGRVNDSTTLTSAQYVLGTNMAPYAIRPFRARPLENDLNVDERKKYAMRQVKLINGEWYALYYLKMIDFTEGPAQLRRYDPVAKVSTPYEIDIDHLSPVPPQNDTNDVVEDVSDYISVVLPGTLVITGEEAFESASVMDGGDMRFAVASEVGFVAASAELVSAKDNNDVPFEYTEAVFAQMVDHYTWIGQGFVHSTDSWVKTFQFSTSNVITQG